MPAATAGETGMDGGGRSGAEDASEKSMSFFSSLLAFFEEVGVRFDPDLCDNACRVNVHQNGHNELNLPTTSGFPRRISVRSGRDALVVFTSAISSALAPYLGARTPSRDHLASIGTCMRAQQLRPKRYGASPRTYDVYSKYTVRLLLDEELHLTLGVQVGLGARVSYERESTDVVLDAFLLKVLLHPADPRDLGCVYTTLGIGP